MWMVLLLLVLLASCHIIASRELLVLHGAKFEMALSSYKYLAVLFVDDSTSSEILEAEWSNASDNLKKLPADAEMAKVYADDPELKEIIDAYGIAVPSIKVFRRGVISDFLGPLNSAGIQKYIIQDAQPSVTKLYNISQMKKVLEANDNTMIFGLFNEDDVGVDEGNEGYSIDPWGQFQAAADSLRGLTSFFAIFSNEVVKSFKLETSELPVIFMVPIDGDGFVKYTGEILEMNLSEWILRNTSPTLDELTLSSSVGQVYLTQFFSSRKLKFILFLTPEMKEDTQLLEYWKNISNKYKKEAIFSYMTDFMVLDVIDFFHIDSKKEIPIIAAYQPGLDHKYKSTQLSHYLHGNSHHNNDNSNSKLQFIMNEFVQGVIDGKVLTILKSEPLPHPNQLKPTKQYPVLKVVGNNVIDVVSKEGKDVLLMVYKPYCAQCKKLVPSFTTLARAVESENRIVIAKIDANLNDIPTIWNVKDYPTLLFFPAKDKPYQDSSLSQDSSIQVIPTPRSYWDAGTSLHELVGFLQRHSSFDRDSLKIATTEQLGSLLGDEEQVRMTYDIEEKRYRRNEGRYFYDNEYVDYVLGEIIYEGKLWHLIVVSITILLLLSYIVYLHVTMVPRSSIVRKKKINGDKEKDNKTH